MNTTNRATTPTSTSADERDLWPALPTETEIYILPDGQVIFADLPMELADLAAQLGAVQPCAIPPSTDRSASG